LFANLGPRGQDQNGLAVHKCVSTFSIVAHITS
jgi:hypothetical protein